MAGKRLTIVVPERLFADFKRISKQRGHTMTWYLLGCVRDIVERSRREEEGKGGEASQSSKSSTVTRRLEK